MSKTFLALSVAWALALPVSAVASGMDGSNAQQSLTELINQLQNNGTLSTTDSPSSQGPSSGDGLLQTLQQAKADGALPDQRNLWPSMVEGFRISDVDRPRVDKWRTWFLQHQGKLEEILHNSRPFLYYVATAVKERGLPMELALLPAIESGYNPRAYSPAAAAGLWQFVPGTARGFGLQNTRWGDPRLSLTASTNAALDYLSYLYNYFGGNWLLAIAAYNAGQGTISAAIQQNVAAGLPTDFWDLHLPNETENYVAELLALAQIVKNAAAYHVALPEIANRAQLALVHPQQSVNLQVAAKLMNVSVSELQHLNAGLRYGVAPAGYALVVPKDKAETLRTALLQQPTELMTTPSISSSLPSSEEAVARTVTPVSEPRPAKAAPSLRYISIHSGETLSQVALRTGVSINDLQRWNHLRSANDLQVGQKLVVYGGKTIPVMTAAQATIKVRPGESLWQISQRAGVNVAALAAANHLSTHSMIHPGQVLRLPAQGSLMAALRPRQEQLATAIPRPTTYVVRPGDTVWQIAAHYHVSPKSVVQWNRLASAADIHPGTRLTIYTR